MLPKQRKREIVEVVSAENGRTVTELAEELGVSEATIRRDLQDLESDGLIERSHGGALPTSSVAEERTYSQKQVQNLEAKRAIGDRAAGEIHAGQVVFFDSGTTTIEVAKAAPDVEFIAATNSPLIAMELGERGDVKLTGGTLREQTWALVGPTGEQFLERTNFDTVFLGTNAIHPDAGLTTPNEDEARMKSLMVEKSQRVVLVSDGSKLGRRSFVHFADLADIDVFVTDATLPDEQREPFEAAGVDVVDGVVR
ncbi:HTH-type transcriptional regulator GlpR [Halosolutus amylolyticus]|uniref:HTH-type transcriptional regulator GlpR n=1 Tax=Halosolutus amylolyticus TaxID=2932267 RepID=A0ABD5PSJ7_9EURY|nr:HTH-type transcriptional regulator GlpR [Halosolutus amylolyticus]